MGVCALQHRQVTGYFNSAVIIKQHGYHKSEQEFNLRSIFSVVIGVFGVLLYSYIICCIFSVYIKVISRSSLVTSSSHHSFQSIPVNTNYFKPISCDAINILFLDLILLLFQIDSSLSLKKIKSFFKGQTLISKVINFVSIWLCSINLLLIIIVTPSIINPGPINSPGSLSVLYHNVQGFVILNELKKEHPALNMTKIGDFQSYVYSAKPDIIILNETWLGKSILDAEIFPNNSYKVFRKDRSSLSHPPDPNKPNKYKKSGGGVLIAIKSDLDVTSVAVKSSVKAELLSVFLKTKLSKKFCITTLYRTGTLEAKNFEEVEKHLSFISNKRDVHKHFFIGDINLNEVSWPGGTSTNELHSKFVDLFNNAGFSQLIDKPTHIGGKILDLLLTNCPQAITNLCVHDLNYICISDHFPITFKIAANVKRLKGIKRKVYSFKRADWDQLNHDLKNVPWRQVFMNCDAQTAWSRFKSILFSRCDINIPMTTIKISFSLHGLIAI